MLGELFELWTCIEWYRLNHFLPGHKHSYDHFSLQSCWSFQVLCKVSLPSCKSQKTRFGSMVQKGNPIHPIHLRYLLMHPFIEFSNDDMIIMIHRELGVAQPESPRQGVKNLTLPAAPELRIFLKSLATVTSTVEKKQLWDRQVAVSSSQTNMLGKPELHTCIWLESKPKFNDPSGD